MATLFFRVNFRIFEKQKTDFSTVLSYIYITIHFYEYIVTIVVIKVFFHKQLV